MDACGEAGEAQGILNGSFRKNFAATSWESCATSSQLRSNFVTTSLYSPSFANWALPAETLAKKLRNGPSESLIS